MLGEYCVSNASLGSALMATGRRSTSSSVRQANRFPSPSVPACPRYGWFKMAVALPVCFLGIRWLHGLNWNLSWFLFHGMDCTYKFQGPLCATARGGLFDTSSSDSWMSIGAWELGLTDLGYGGNGDYGLETILVSNTLERSVTTVNSALVAAINTTDFYQGMVGVGATQGRFHDKVANPLISQLAESYNTIPGHSYGFTAGASYGRQLHLYSCFRVLTYVCSECSCLVDIGRL